MKTKFCISILQCLFFVGFAQQNISSIEYYFDADPGIGGATTLTVNANATIDSNFTIPIGNLTEGFHTLYMRAKDDANIWGLYDRRVFYVVKPSEASISNLASAEYYFDTDPGIGNATVLAISSDASIDDNFSIPIGNLTEGFHTLYIRVKNEANTWSLYDRRVFFVTAAALSNNATISNMEYFFDTDPGLSNGIALTVPANPSLENIFDIDVSSLTEGSHLLFIRAKNTADIWSINAMAAFTIDNTLGIQDFSNQFTVFPNSFKDNLTVNSTFEIEGFQMYNLTGKVVLQKQTKSNKIDTKNLSSGVYFLVINSKVGKVVKKIIKE
ncbi:MAG: T9SS type A sorting domain-containing protein [Polaribacter sp.]|nr:T9SS type A sorting domain-containing protein [Polaribacter sp.]